VDAALVLGESRLVKVGPRRELPLLEPAAPASLADAGTDVTGKAVPDRTVKKSGRHRDEYAVGQALVSTFRCFLPNALHQEHKGKGEKLSVTP
jgi:hypothetical protein